MLAGWRRYSTRSGRNNLLQIFHKHFDFSCRSEYSAASLNEWLLPQAFTLRFLWSTASDDTRRDLRPDIVRSQGLERNEILLVMRDPRAVGSVRTMRLARDEPLCKAAA